MAYSEDFKKKCLEVYPDFEELRIALENDHAVVGWCLDFGIRANAITADDILNASSLEELQETAAKLKVKENLYKEWCSMH